MVPALLLILVFKIYPIFLALYGSFLHSVGGQMKEFAGLQNYINLFHDPVFWKSLKVTLVFNVIVNPVQIGLAILLALMVNQKFKGVTVIRSILYLPVTISISVAAIIWGILLNPNNGVVNGILGSMGLSAQPFLVSEKQALWSIILIASWKGIAYWMMFLLAGLQGIPESLYEAARVDGSNVFQTTFRIVLPMLKRSIAFVVVADTVANLLMFSPMYLLTSGGPNMSTNVLMYEAYKSNFAYVDMGRSYSMVIVLFILIFSIVGFQLKFLKADY